MHYRDGTPARVGDRVRGTGYNVKNEAGEPVEFDGVVVGLNPRTDKCNVEVAFVRVVPMPSASAMVPAYSSSPMPPQIVAKGAPCVTLAIEYGETSAFDFTGPRTDDRFAKPTE